MSPLRQFAERATNGSIFVCERQIPPSSVFADKSGQCGLVESTQLARQSDALKVSQDDISIFDRRCPSGVAPEGVRTVRSECASLQGIGVDFRKIGVRVTRLCVSYVFAEAPSRGPHLARSHQFVESKHPLNPPRFPLAVPSPQCD